MMDRLCVLNDHGYNKTSNIVQSTESKCRVPKYRAHSGHPLILNSPQTLPTSALALANPSSTTPSTCLVLSSRCKSTNSFARWRSRSLSAA